MLGTTNMSEHDLSQIEKILRSVIFVMIMLAMVKRGKADQIYKPSNGKGDHQGVAQ